MSHVTAAMASVFDAQLQDIKTFEDLKRSVAAEIRASNQNNNVNIDELSTDELLNASNEIIKIVHGESLADVINILKAKKCLPRSKKYIALSLFVDENGILRVGGRWICQLASQRTIKAVLNQ